MAPSRSLYVIKKSEDKSVQKTRHLDNTTTKTVVSVHGGGGVSGADILPSPELINTIACAQLTADKSFKGGCRRAHRKMFGNYKSFANIYARRIDVSRDYPVFNESLECHRVLTYENFPTLLLHLVPSLAKAGLVYTGDEDLTRCFECQVKLGGWIHTNKTPQDRHYLASPHCPTANMQSTRNIPDELACTEKWRLLSFFNNMLPLYNVDSVNLAGAGFYLTQRVKTKKPRAGNAIVRCFECGIEVQLSHVASPRFINDPMSGHLGLNSYCLFANRIECGNVVYNNFCLEAHRVRSFAPTHLPLRITERYAARGFAYSPPDHMMCFSCFEQREFHGDRELIGWAGHAKNCAFANGRMTHNLPRILPSRVDPQFTQFDFASVVALNNSYYPTGTEVCEIEGGGRIRMRPPVANFFSILLQPHAPPAQKPTPAEIEDGHRLCKVCYENELEMCALPCGHFATCIRCANKTPNCVVCRMPIIQRIRAFI